MQPTKFDTISRSFAHSSSRRRALRAASGGGLLGLLGISAAAAQDDPVECEMTFRAQTVTGPSRETEYEGLLNFVIESDGSIDDAYLTIDDQEFDAVGTANGRELFLRIDFEDDHALSLFGVGEHDIDRCRGSIEGSFGGPEMQDLGRWILAEETEEQTQRSNGALEV